MENSMMTKINEVIENNDLNSRFETYQGEDFLLLEAYEELEIIEAAIGMELYKATDDNYGFSDEYTTCSRCGNLVKTSPDSYAWTPDYAILYECELVCKDCLEFDEYITELINDPKKANTIFDESEILDHDFIKLNEDDYESGWYGQVDDPKDIFNQVSEKYDEIIFSITNQEQFRTEFAVYGRYPIANTEDEEDII